MIALALSAALLATAAAVPSAAPVPLADFARTELYHSAKISPAGEYIALDTQEKGQRALVVMDLATRKMSGAIFLPHGQWVADYWWVGPSRIVIAVAIAQGQLDQPRLTGELYAMNADGSGKAYLFGFRGGAVTGTRLGGEPRLASAYMLDPMPRDPAHALIAVVPWGNGADVRDPAINLIDVVGGALTSVATLPLFAPFNVAADAAGKPRFAIGYDGKQRERVLVRDTPGADWRLLTELPLLTGAAAIYGLADDLAAIYSSNEDTDRTCLREYHFKDSARRQLSCNASVDLDYVQTLAEGHQPAAAVYEDGKPHVDYFDANTDDARLMRTLDNSFGGQRVRVTSSTLDGSKLVLLVDSDQNPGDFFIYDRATRKAKYMLSRREWIVPETMSVMQPIAFKARDGVPLNGYLTLPRSAAGKAPLVLMPHGGPHGIRDFWEWDNDVQVLASRGYAVLQVNFRGSGGYGRAHEEAGYRHWSTLMQDDLTDGVRWAIAQGIADPARVCIYGASYGGYAAMMSAIREPDLYKCAAAYAGVYDLKIQSEDSDIAESHLGRYYLERSVGSDSQQLLDQSPVNHVDALKAAVLLAHGTADKRVPISQAKELRKALEKAGKKPEWLALDGEEHGFFKDENHVLFYKKLLDFLERNIGPGATGATPAIPAP